MPGYGPDGLNKDRKGNGVVHTEYEQDFRKRSDYYGHDHFGSRQFDKDGNIDVNAKKEVDV